ncbi:MAG: hypothetical protein KTR14_01530 [Vampirovibrio sp.]|nr:hypothetical protein [Vampirovibrio sp.]
MSSSSVNNMQATQQANQMGGQQASASGMGDAAPPELLNFGMANANGNSQNLLTQSFTFNNPSMNPMEQMMQLFGQLLSFMGTMMGAMGGSGAPPLRATLSTNQSPMQLATPALSQNPIARIMLDQIRTLSSNDSTTISALARLEVLAQGMGNQAKSEVDTLRQIADHQGTVEVITSLKGVLANLQPGSQQAIQTQRRIDDLSRSIGIDPFQGNQAVELAPTLSQDPITRFMLDQIRTLSSNDPRTISALARLEALAPGLGQEAIAEVQLLRETAQRQGTQEVINSLEAVLANLEPGSQQAIETQQRIDELRNSL